MTTIAKRNMNSTSSGNVFVNDFCPSISVSIFKASAFHCISYVLDSRF